jgi:membrane-anchored protein YejM (alkaline phosphatase superfamily)
VKNEPESISARVRRGAALRLWLANIAFAAVVGSNYLVHVPEVDGFRLWLFALPALLSTVVMLTALPGGLFILLATYVRSERTLGWLQTGVWTFFQVLLFADTRIYNMFSYHFNGQVLNLMYVRGSEDAIHLGWQVWTWISTGLVAVSLVQLWLWRRALVVSAKVQASGTRGPLWRPSIVWCAILLPSILVEKTLYAQADLSQDRQMTAMARIFPLYARVPAEDLASAVLGVDSQKPQRIELEGVELEYPLAMPTVDPDGARPNVLVLVIDCLRRDMLDADVMPNLHAFARDARRFDDHISAGNSTRYGIFSMIYGLHGSYWFPILQEERGPVLLDVLLAEGYEVGVFSSATMSYPELRETAWSNVAENVHDENDGELPWQRDVQAGEAAASWLGERAEGDAPFFGFVLLDSPHQTYSHPPEAAKFEPAAAEVDYMALTTNDGPGPEELELIFNRYRNAVYHSDTVAGDILAALDDAGLAEDTVVIVTGDHGEEFLECGFFGHTSAFTPQQLGVPFVVRGPGVEPGVETRPTSHIDVAPTLLELLGADPGQRADWCLGKNFLSPSIERRRVVSAWNELGIWTPRGIIRVPLALLEFDLELYDYGWNLELDDREALAAETETLERLSAECNRFLR